MAPIRRQTRMRNIWDVSNSLWSVAELWEGYCVGAVCTIIMYYVHGKIPGPEQVGCEYPEKEGTSNYAKGGVSKNKATKSKAQSPRATKNSEYSKASSSSNAQGQRKLWESQEKLQSRQAQLEKKVEECITLQKRNSMELHDSAAGTSSGSSGRVRDDSA